MKIVCVKEKIQKAIVFAEKFTGKNSTLPVLGSILITASGDSVKIRATNLELGIEFEVPVQVEQEGEIAISGSLLSNILSNIQAAKNITLETKNENLFISTEQTSTYIKGVDADDFPTLPVVEGDTISLEGYKIAQGIKSVAFSASQSDIKAEIASVYIYHQEKEIVFAATDQIRLAEKRIEVKEKDTGLNIILPIKNALEIARVLEDTDKSVDIVFSGNQVSFVGDHMYITSRIINGAFPDYKQIIPKEFFSEVVVLKQDFANALKIANIISDKFHRIDFVVRPQDNLFEVQSQNIDIGENTTQIDAALKGDTVNISFNQKYLVDCLQSIPQDSVSLQFSGPNKPLLIKGVGDQSFAYLVMPMND